MISIYVYIYIYIYIYIIIKCRKRFAWDFKKSPGQLKYVEKCEKERETSSNMILIIKKRNSNEDVVYDGFGD